MDEGGTQQADAQKVGDLWCVGAVELRFEERTLDLGGSAASPLLGPAHAQEARRVELALPGAPHLDQRVRVV